MATKKFCDICGYELSSHLYTDEVILKDTGDNESLNYDICFDCKLEI